MKKLFIIVACLAMNMLSIAQNNQLVWANGRLLYGTPITNIDSLTYDEAVGMDTLLLPRTLIKLIHDTVVIDTKIVHDTVYIRDTVYVELPCTNMPSDSTLSTLGIGVFSVGNGKQVTFSPGNLQYHPANDEWRFAENQTDYIGAANSNIAADYDGWLDLFGWGTGNAPTKSSTDYRDYQTFVDWGTNQIGSDAPNTWRTLTYDEWYYLRNSRTNANDLCGVAQVNGVNGLILFPDNWICPAGATFKSGFHSIYGAECYAAYQAFTAEQWTKLEAAGAVFLPAAGDRFSSDVDIHVVQYRGYYWSATEYSSYDACCLLFYSDRAGMNYDIRGYGRSVRLVKDL